MLMAAFVSLSSSQPHSQKCHRSDKSFLRTVPHCEQTWEVYLGFTFCCRPVRKIRSILTLFGLGTLADIRDLKLFKDNGLMLLDQLPGLFVMEVPSLIGNLPMSLGYCFAGFLTSVAPALLSRQGSLQLLQLPLCAAIIAG